MLAARAAMRGTLNYDVTNWPVYPDIAAFCHDIGLAATRWMNCASAYDPACWVTSPPGMVSVAEQASVELGRLGLLATDVVRLEAAIAVYQTEAERAFRRAAEAEADVAARVDYYIPYHAPPLNLLFRLAEVPRPAPQGRVLGDTMTRGDATGGRERSRSFPPFRIAGDVPHYKSRTVGTTVRPHLANRERARDRRRRLAVAGEGE